jgi:4,5-dihydroxyphthalate decarboxylase
MTALDLSVCFWNYDRTMPLYDGRVPIAGCVPRISILTPEQAFDRTFVTDEFDAGELSLSYHLSALARGDARYVAIPVFPSRSFRHSTIYIRSDCGINSPQDLVGKRLGVQDYDMTAAVVVRGFLRDDYGVSAEQIAWTIGDVESLWRTEISVRRVAGCRNVDDYRTYAGQHAHER